MPTKDYSDEIRKAVRFYWHTKKAAHKKTKQEIRKTLAIAVARSGARILTASLTFSPSWLRKQARSHSQYIEIGRKSSCPDIFGRPNNGTLS